MSKTTPSPTPESPPMTRMLEKAAVGVPQESVLDGPWLQHNHVDGPLLIWAGLMHWLTWRERLSLLFRRTSITELGEKRWPHLARLRRSILSEKEKT